MALIGFHYSKFFEEKLLNGEIKGTIVMGNWKIPLNEELFVYAAPENAETSKEDKKVGTAKILSCKSMQVKELTDKEAEACAFENAEKLKEGVKKWHKCEDSDTITFIGFEFEKI